ncbi:MAG: glycerol-3-phosphate dehydrogenase/oxidase [Anaerolineales bacterium]
MMNREHTIERILANPKVQVLIIGAGINGIGTFRDLAMQGVEVLLVDRGDYCSGTSAASSHMVHGGIRYLENGEFRLVREAVRERNRLLENAPHLVHPLPTVFPIFRTFSGLLNAPLKFLGWLDKPSERGAIVIKIGMSLYDFYTRDQKTLPRHRFWGRRRSLKKFPELNRKIIYTGTYYDGAMPSPERICIELIQDTLALSEKACAANYVRFDRLEGDKVILVDEINGEQFPVEPDLVVNATGPWIDFTNAALGKRTEFIGGTKGSHLMLDHPALRDAIQGHEFFFENQDGRIVLIYPLGDKVLIGTSDIRIEDPDEAGCTFGEIDYFFEMAARVFPGINLDRSQIVFQFSGVRPLPYSPDVCTGQISRDHKIEVIEPGEVASFPVLSLVGGKWTTFRAFSEQTTDEVLAYFNQERITDTREMPIGGSKGLPREEAGLKEYRASLVERYDAPEKLVEILVGRYGTRAPDILAQPTLVSPTGFWSVTSYTPEEIDFLAKMEDIVHLDDLILRRTMIGKLGLLNDAGLLELAEITAGAKGWSDEFKREEIRRARRLLREQHAVVLEDTAER